MTDGDPFGPRDDEFDRFAREMGEGLKDLMGRFLAGQGGQIAWSKLTDAATRRDPAPRPETPPRPEAAAAADAGTGVWAVVVAGDDGLRVEQVFPTELEALRANQHNAEPNRRVRFLPYGIAVSALLGE